MNHHHNTQKSFSASESGNVFILVAFGLFMLVASVAVAVDMTRAFLLHSKAQSALDAALVAASSIAHRGISHEELLARATNFRDANFPVNYMGTTFNTFNVAFDENTGKVSGNLTVHYTPIFAEVLGLADQNFLVNVSGEVTRVLGRDLEIALALDHTSSMCAPLLCTGGACNNAAPCEGTKANSRIALLRDGVKVFFETIQEATDATIDSDAKVLYSYIPFNHDVKINNKVMHKGASYLPNILGLREASKPILDAMDDINIEDEGNTNAAKGLAWGWRSLRRPDRNLFTGVSKHEFADHPKVAGDEDTIKALILFSDGINEFTYYDQESARVIPICNPDGCKEPFTDWRNPLPGANRGTAHANANMEALCTAIHKEGIRIFPIILNQDSSSPQFAEIRRIATACAAPAATAFYPTTAAQLRAVFRQIARELINLRITK